MVLKNWGMMEWMVLMKVCSEVFDNALVELRVRHVPLSSEVHVHITGQVDWLFHHDAEQSVLPFCTLMNVQPRMVLSSHHIGLEGEGEECDIVGGVHHGIPRMIVVCH